jgi:hypothetical protein
MTSEFGLPAPGPAPRTEEGIPVTLTAGGGFLACELRSVHADGIVVAAVAPLPAGTSTIARLADAVSGVEYEIPCSVVWSRTYTPASIALRVDGAPLRSEFSIPPVGMWRSPLGFRPSQMVQRAE